MSKIISLLEKMGQNAEFRYANAEQLACLMANTDPALIDAVIAGDQAGLEQLLGARTNVVCGIHPADQPDEEPQDEPGDQPEKEAGSVLKVG
ncbi:hypothetical protein [Rheinheimera sp. MM224]|uniref:hypothetical protein n=1 Tax=Rheinheimera sp. MM224 TaxID=3019969 RepID=UPI0021F82217|nr:hypothetical protein [Rheinheimera sp. MM224]CAI3790655.1 hypothetical protein JAMGFMIE_00086 [Rheinheimera sp. MM224]